MPSAFKVFRYVSWIVQAGMLVHRPIASGPHEDTLASRRLSGVERDRVIYHQGHGPSYVTRLSRFDRTLGMPAFIEDEENWRLGLSKESRRRTLVSAGNGRLESRHRSQRHKVQVLMDHFVGETSLIQMASSEIELKESLFPQPGKEDPPTEFVPHRLSDIGALYVAPIGVGTKPKAQSLGQINENLLGKDDNVPECPISVSETMKLEEGRRAECMSKQLSELWVVFDTGSTNIWISSDLCELGPCAEEGRVRFNHTKSPTFSWTSPRIDLSVRFGTGSLKGPLGKDHLHIGPASVKDQVFALIQEQKGAVFENPFEGIVGLAFPALATKSAPAFFDSLIKQEVLPHNEFSIYLNNQNTAANAMFWGGVDNAFFKGPVEFFPVVDPFYWSLQLHSFKIGDKVLLGEGAQLDSLMDQGDATAIATPPLGPRAIVDTGTTYFTAEPSLYKKVEEMLPKARNCDKITAKSHPPITFTLKNSAGELRPFEIPYEHYMVREEDSKECTLGFMQISIPKEHGPGMMLGEIFLKHYYAVFDRQDGDVKKGRVGFAQSLHTKEVLDHLRNLTKAQPSFVEARKELAESSLLSRRESTEARGN